MGKCRPHLYKTDECYYCSYGEDNDKAINIYSIQNEECIPLDYCDKYVVIETSECVDDCEPGKVFVTNLDNEIYYRCINSCPSGYYVKNGKCVDICEDYIRKGNICDISCDDSEYLFTKEEENIDGTKTIKKYCVDNCPRFFSNDSPNKICKEKCEEEEFYSITDNECLSDCEGMTFIDLSSNIFQCTEEDKPASIVASIESYKCQEPFPFQYQYSCLRNCADTENLKLFNYKKTYSLIYEEDIDGQIYIAKFCSEYCSETQSTNPKNYFDSSTSSCHQSCKETSHKFYYIYQYGKECLDSGDKLRYPYHMPDGECVSVNKCSEKGEYYLLREENACVEECPQNSEFKYINKDYDECTTCNKPNNEKDIKNGEGYIVKKGEKEYCYNSCSETINDQPQYYYRRNDDNNCFQSGEKCDTEYKFSIYKKNEDPDNIKYHICYKSYGW